MISEYRHNLGLEDLVDEIETAECQDCGEEHNVEEMDIIKGGEIRHKSGFIITDTFNNCPSCKVIA